ncbi:MAG: GNAT family N-acetyltransferase [Prevotellaceae bacterium]|jgi:hypothetical protein|nr:GNAT family N-acetyltransferase [Prevotellaceae bacterium]
MIPVIPPIDPKSLKKELTKSHFLRPTNKAHNEIYIVDSATAPHVMAEIGRLRELSFRSWGGGSGNQLDTDEYDYLQKPYQQLIVWNPDDNEIVGAYRFLAGADAEFDENGQPHLTMGHLFKFSQRFIQEYLPYTVELGRAFVQPKYQSSAMGMKSLFALDNLWDGLGALIHEIKDAKYFVGKVTIYQNYSLLSRNLIFAYLRRYCPDPDQLITPNKPTPISEEHRRVANALFRNKNAADGYKALQKAVRADNQTIPPLINAYVGLTETMRSFGTIYDATFGNVFETGIMITIPDLLEVKQKRYIEPYINYLRIILEEQKRKRQLARARKKEAQERTK